MNKKRFIALVLVVLTFTAIFASCRSKKTTPPTFESVKDELVLRIKNSVEINKVFFGDGLKTIARDSEEAEETGVYNTENESEIFVYWEIVALDCGYVSIDDIKAKAEEAYSKKYLEGVYTAQFTGIYDFINGYATEAHYFEDNNWMYKNTDPDNPFLVESKSRIFDYNSMKMNEDKSSAERIYIEIQSHLEDDDDIITTTLVFDKDEKGNWLLSTPTY